MKKWYLIEKNTKGKMESVGLQLKREKKNVIYVLEEER